MSDVPARLRRLVLQRAESRCEYCGLSQEGQEASFHVDHIVPKAAQGPTRADNLALACVACSLRKEARRSAVDPMGRSQSRSIPTASPAMARPLSLGGSSYLGLDPYGAGYGLRSADESPADPSNTRGGGTA